MNKKKIDSEIDFADSEYKSFNMSENYILTINMNNWQEKSFKIIFVNTIQFVYKLGDIPKGVFELSNDDSSFFNEALLLEYGYMPSQHPFKLFQLEDIDDFPFIQVVAESVTVVKD